MLAQVNAGHAAPYPLRPDEVEVLDLPPDLPFGLFQRTTYRSSYVHQEPGNRLVLVTDGISSATPPTLHLPPLIDRTRELPPREATSAPTGLGLDVIVARVGR